MTTTQAGHFVYVIRLRHGDPRDPAALSGRLEHVMSGRQHDFDDAQSLLACLAHEQAQVARAQGLERRGPAPRAVGLGR
jgi:hypothetical protein